MSGPLAAAEAGDEITLGDIAAVLEALRARGATHQSVTHTIGRVFWAEIDAERKANARMRDLAAEILARRPGA